MSARMPSRPALAIVTLACVLPLCQPQAPAAQDTRVPQTALSLCPALTVVAQQTVPAGTAIAVSPDGRYLAEYVHTTRGAELTLRQRDTGSERRVRLDLPQLPPGVLWRIHEIVFSPSGETLAVRSVGAIWVLATDTGKIRYQIGFDKAKETYPGKLSIAGDRLAVVFWPPESYLADARAKPPVEVRLYDLATGRALYSLALPLDSSNQWTELRLSPDASRLAVLQRPTRWPGKARLAVFAADSGKFLWEKKEGAEDLAWSAGGSQLVTLGGQLSWLDAATGKKLRGAEKSLRFSELQTLRLSEAANLAVGHFVRYNPLKRTLVLNDRRNTRVLVWRADTGKALCELSLRPEMTADVWPTPRGELIALEETYEVRPPLRLLRGARRVTYRLSPP